MAANQTPAEIAAENAYENRIALRLLLGVVVAAVLAGVVTALFGLAALTVVGLVGTLAVFVLMVLYAAGR